MESYPLEFEKALGYRFKKRELLMTALTHSSRAHETGSPGKSNERMEFLGDSILDFLTAKAVYRRFPECDEGIMTEMRARAVCEGALAGYAEQIRLGEYIMLGRGEAKSHGERRPSTLSDTFESVVAAIYLDGGMKEAERFVLPFITKNLTLSGGEPLRDYKTMLQELVQKDPDSSLTYEMSGENGPPHDKNFEMTVLLGSERLASAWGKTKKEAAQKAAKEALRILESRR